MDHFYCSFVKNKGKGTLHEHYHDHEYGFPLQSDNEFFARLVLEINQADLSWKTILKKKSNFYAAFDHFDIDTVSRYTPQNVEVLMQDAGIVRNRLKIHVAIENAKTIKALQKEMGSFKNWPNHHHPKTKEEWTKLFKKMFRFTSGEIVNEFLMSTGYLLWCHSEECPVFKKIAQLRPMWMQSLT